jgi:hypothetical protein
MDKDTDGFCDKNLPATVFICCLYYGSQAAANIRQSFRRIQNLVDDRIADIAVQLF